MVNACTSREVSKDQGYLSPDVLVRLMISRDPPSVPVNDLIDATYLPWAEQMWLSLEVIRTSPLARLQGKPAANEQKGQCQMKDHCWPQQETSGTACDAQEGKVQCDGRAIRQHP